MKNLCIDSSTSNASFSARNCSTASQGPGPKRVDDDVGTPWYPRTPEAQLGEHVVASVGRVQHDEQPSLTHHLHDAIGQRRVCGGAAEVGDAWVLRAVGLRLDVDRDDLPVAEKVEYPREVVSATAVLGAGLDEHVGTQLVNHLLVEPQV